MKGLNAKRIAAIAASLLIGLASASVTFQNIPIINTAGQPVVQIVVGSTAQPSDGVVAANIGATIGSLAHSSQNITATVNGRSGVKCVVTTPTCTLSNQQVWLGESGAVTPSGAFSFTALIGSVLNAGVLNAGNLPNTKSLQSSTSYTYTEGSSPYPITSTPNPTSVWAGTPSAPLTPQISVTSTTNGGGLTFTQFFKSTAGVDNIVRIGNAQVPGLQNSAGTYQETTALWLGGFPVFNQTGNGFQVIDGNAAYLVTFGKPIQNKTNGAGTTATISLLGQNWTLYNMIPPSGSGTGVTSNSFIVGGNVTLAAASTLLTTVYVGQNMTSGPFKVVLNDLSYPTSNGLSNAALSVFFNGVLTNTTSVGPAGPSTVTINDSNTKLFIKVTQTFPGLYAYQKWAKIQLFSTLFNVTSGKNYNTANGNTWIATLRWTTNTSVAPGSQAAFSANAALQGIVLTTNQSAQGIWKPGASFNFITSPARWKLTFVGDTLGAPGSGNSNYDPLTITTSVATCTIGSISCSYLNEGTGAGATNTVPTITFNAGGYNSLVGAPGAGDTYISNTINDTIVTEPLNLFTVSSSIPTAFIVTPSPTTVASPTSNLQTLMYDLNGYTFVPQNAVDKAGTTNLVALGSTAGLEVVLKNTGNIAANYISSSNQETITITGYKSGATTATSTTVQAQGFTGPNDILTANGVVYANITNIALSYLPPNSLSVDLYEDSLTTNTPGQGSSILMAQLKPYSPVLLYKVPQYGYYQAPNALAGATTAQYTGQQNNVNFDVRLPAAPPANTARSVFFTYNMPEIVNPTVSTPGANTEVLISNSSSSTTSPASNPYMLNYTPGASLYAAQASSVIGYLSSTNTLVGAGPGFRTEHGSDIGSVGTTQVVYYMAKPIDALRFIVGPANTSTVSTTAKYGPYTVGQSTNLPNVTIAQVNATCAFSTTSCSITGLSNLTGVPSATQAIVANPLNTVTTPLAVLDSGANNASTLVVIGSYFVNSQAQQIFSQNPSLQSSFGPSGSGSVIVQAFGTNRVLVAGYSASQTVQAGNQFIQALLSATS